MLQGNGADQTVVVPTVVRAECGYGRDLNLESGILEGMTVEAG